MDSRDLLRAAGEPWLHDRATWDGIMWRVLKWVGTASRPEDVFSADRLAQWATQHGYALSTDMPELIALLREIELGLDHPSRLATRAQDAIWRFTNHDV